ncbi:MAG: DsbA family protein [Alphaproteobacteria bacterium]|nr:DsbA family protein [Alphaproteobacteria bacterium]
MNFAIRSLLILTMLTSAVYGEQRNEPEKTILEKIVESFFPEKAAETTTEITIPEKAVETTPQTTTPEKVAETAPSANTSKKTIGKAPEKMAAKPLPEISVGSKDAPVVMINYSSLSCGHCAHFNADILPKIEEKYIKPGYLRIVFRDYPGDQVSLRAHQLAWCKGEIKYLDFIKLLYAHQEKWLFADDPVVALKSIALQNGISAKQFEACLKNQELLDQIIAVRLEGQQKYNITVTPTIVINAKIYQKALDLEEIDDIIKPLLASIVEKEKDVPKLAKNPDKKG